MFWRKHTSIFKKYSGSWIACTKSLTWAIAHHRRTLHKTPSLIITLKKKVAEETTTLNGTPPPKLCFIVCDDGHCIESSQRISCLCNLQMNFLYTQRLFEKKTEEKCSWEGRCTFTVLLNCRGTSFLLQHCPSPPPFLGLVDLQLTRVAGSISDGPCHASLCPGTH